MLTVIDVNNDNYVCNAAGITPTPARTETEFRVLIDPQSGRKYNKLCGVAVNISVCVGLPLVLKVEGLSRAAVNIAVCVGL